MRIGRYRLKSKEYPTSLETRTRFYHSLCRLEMKFASFAPFGNSSSSTPDMYEANPSVGIMRMLKDLY